jgi:hypothetical protein
MNSCYGNRRDSTTEAVRFRLLADRIGVRADVQLRNAGDRWISVSDSCGRQVVNGIGPTARAAIVASLDWLGPATVSELLADLRLLDVSRQLHEFSAG